MTKFKLQRYALGRQPELEITRAEFDSIVSARSKVLEGLAMEELFNIVLGNYEEFEREVLIIALRHSTYYDSMKDWDSAMDELQLLARRLANVLTTAHGYCDQIPHVISTLFGKTSQHLETVRGFFRHEHSQTFAYRVCAELRRYVQHRGSAVHGFNVASSWVTRGRDDHNQVRIRTIVPEISTRKLREDTKFKSQIIATLEAEGRTSSHTDEVMCDLRPIVREYLAALGRVHLKVREIVSSELDEADEIIQNAVTRFRELSGVDSAIGLAVMELGDKDLLEGRFPTFVSTEPIERRHQLKSRNFRPTQFDISIVTNEVLRDRT